MKFINLLIVAILMISFTAAFSTTQITAPTEFLYSEKLDINISGGINASGFSYLTVNQTETINVTILNKSSSAGAYGILESSLPLTINASNNMTEYFWNFTANFTNERHWIKLNFTNVSRADDGSFGGALTAERIVQIDIARDILDIGYYNLSFTTKDGTESCCGVSDANVWDCVSC